MASSSSVKPERADQVLALVETASPTVLLLDVRLPDASGLEVNRWLAEHHPEVRVVMLTMSEDLDNALTALRDGASGYLVKGAGPERVEHAMRTVASGDVVLDHTPRPRCHRVGTGSPRVDDSPVPAAHQPRVRHPPTPRRGTRQRVDRPPARAQPEDGAQPRLQRLRQDPGPRSTRRHRPRPSARPRDLTDARRPDPVCPISSIRVNVNAHNRQRRRLQGTDTLHLPRWQKEEGNDSRDW